MITLQCHDSIGVLQSGQVNFQPQLPVWKSEAIHMMKMTSYIKIFIKFPNNVKRFWDDKHYIMYADPHVKGRFTAWQNLEAGDKYFPKYWNIYLLILLFCMWRGTNLLLATVVGDFYDTISKMRKEEVMEELYSVLQGMYGNTRFWLVDKNNS